MQTIRINQFIISATVRAKQWCLAEVDWWLNESVFKHVLLNFFCHLEMSTAMLSCHSASLQLAWKTEQSYSEVCLCSFQQHSCSCSGGFHSATAMEIGVGRKSATSSSSLERQTKVLILQAGRVRERPTHPNFNTSPHAIKQTHLHKLDLKKGKTVSSTYSFPVLSSRSILGTYINNMQIVMRQICSVPLASEISPQFCLSYNL